MLCIAIFAAVSQKSLQHSENLQADITNESVALTVEGTQPSQEAVPTVTPTPPPISRAAPKPTSTPKPTEANRCIVTVQGKRYDVTSLRKTHSGGNIFTCGKDMTTTFTAQHGTNINMLKQYLIS